MECMPSSQCLSSLALAFATMITKGLTPNEINVLGLFLTVLADNVSLIAAINQIKCEELENESSGNSDNSASSDANTTSDTIQSENMIKPPANPNKS